MNNLINIEMFAGYNAGQPVAEQLLARPLDEPGQFQLVKSPAFIKGLAAGDVIALDEDQQFSLVRHSGNLCVRVYGDLAGKTETLTGELEKLGAELDVQTPRLQVYSLHVSLGFQTIEALLDQYLPAGCQWAYGNVYDPADGETPLNWWQEILAE